MLALTLAIPSLGCLLPYVAPSPARPRGLIYFSFDDTKGLQPAVTIDGRRVDLIPAWTADGEMVFGPVPASPGYHEVIVHLTYTTGGSQWQSNSHWETTPTYTVGGVTSSTKLVNDPPTLVPDTTEIDLCGEKIDVDVRGEEEYVVDVSLERDEARHRFASRFSCVLTCGPADGPSSSSRHQGDQDPSAFDTGEVDTFPSASRDAGGVSIQRAPTLPASAIQELADLIDQRLGRAPSTTPDQQQTEVWAIWTRLAAGKSISQIIEAADRGAAVVGAEVPMEDILEAGFER